MNEYTLPRRQVTVLGLMRGQTMVDAVLPWVGAVVLILGFAAFFFTRVLELLVACSLAGVFLIAFFSSPFGVRSLFLRSLDVRRRRRLFRKGEDNYASAAAFAGIEAGRHVPGRPPACVGVYGWVEVPALGGKVCCFYSRIGDGVQYGVTLEVNGFFGGLEDVPRQERVRASVARQLSAVVGDFDRAAMITTCSYGDRRTPEGKSERAAVLCDELAALEESSPSYSYYLTLWATSSRELRRVVRQARESGESDPHVTAARHIASRLGAVKSGLETAGVKVLAPLDSQRLAAVNRAIVDRSISARDRTPTDLSRMVPPLVRGANEMGVMGAFGDGWLRGFEVSDFSDEAKSATSFVPLCYLGGSASGRTLEYSYVVIVDVRSRVSTLNESLRTIEGDALRAELRVKADRVHASLPSAADERAFNVRAEGGGWAGGYGAAFFVVNSPTKDALEDDCEALVDAARAAGVTVQPFPAPRQDQAVVCGMTLGRGLARVL